MFAKILIANRGEIACRVITTARRMGIASVAVYSQADALSPHVAMADEAVEIGPGPAAESYLRQEKIIAACLATGAQAVHPGYGFLSENAAFVRALEAAGIAFIGPPAGALAAMGDKIESKRIAAEAGVNVVPGSAGAVGSTAEALTEADRIGYPVMIKASAGGGGKGLRVAWNAAEVEEGFPATQREGLNSFGDDRVFLEKFIEAPRHIEIQVLGDQHGTILHLNERECSIQRRHQKVIEEAPSPFVTPEMRARMGAQAVALARAVGYFSAGTVELIVSGADPTGNSFYFLEMNTRLQVEHPVTEAITGIDLVEQMIRVAAGEPLGFGQGDIGIDGWAIEARVYAEDPYRNFVPSIGRVSRYHPPVPAWTGGLRGVMQDGVDGTGAGGIRVDDGVAEGGAISMYYDPMVAKLVTWGPTREAAAKLQVRALDDFRIEGPRHNIDFLSALVQHPRFRRGELTTAFIAEEFPDGFAGAPVDAERVRLLAAIAAELEARRHTRANAISGQLDGRQSVPASWAVRIAARDHHVTLHGETGESHALVDDHLVRFSCNWRPGMRGAVVVAPGVRLGLKVERERGHWALTTHGARHEARVLPARLAGLAVHMIEKVAPDRSRMLIAPMAGLLVQLRVAAGDAVEIGQPLAVMEAMKMEMILRAEARGTVAAIHAAEGDGLAAETVILELG